MVAEADESDRSFLKLSPTIAVLTNIDREHMETYGTFDALVDAFVDFAGRVPFYGAVIACRDDGPVAAMLPRLTRRIVTYGFADGADVQGVDPVSDGRSGRCGVRYHLRGLPSGTGDGTLSLAVPGRHNLQNALAAIAVGLEVGVPFDRIAAALAEFRGAERRYQIRGVVNGDGRPPRLVAVFQPHRYSRTRDLLDEFGPALALADDVVLLDIYAAGEAPIAGATLDALAAAVRRHVKSLHVVREFDAAAAAIGQLARPGDVVVTLGAGSIGTLPDRILRALGAAEVRR
jgi:UDP-N-acetylmuramate--alanine ligase